MKNGFFAEEDYPYVSGDNGTEPLCYLDKKEAIGGIKGYVDVAGNDEAAHLIALNSQPLAISLDASTFHNYHSGVLQFEDCGSDLNHAVLLVGYGTDEETGIPFWLVRNSWGPQYGEDGCKCLLGDSLSFPLSLSLFFPHQGNLHVYKYIHAQKTSVLPVLPTVRSTRPLLMAWAAKAS